MFVLTMSAIKIKFDYPKHFDLVFHALAYFKVNNASNLYDEAYIAKMGGEKRDFNSLENYYNENFERLMMINFLPFYADGFEDMKNIFMSFNCFTEKDLEKFIKPFIEILDKESLFFFDYWEKTDAAYKPIKKITEERFTRKLNIFSNVFDYFEKSCEVLFSYNITNNGRGFYKEDSFAALVRFPRNDDEIIYSFLQLLHEYTHVFTDGLINENINMSDGSHELSENAVILTDYYLIKALDENLIPEYFEWLNGGRGGELNEDEFLNIFKVNGELNKKLLNMTCLVTSADYNQPIKF